MLDWLSLIEPIRSANAKTADVTSRCCDLLDVPEGDLNMFDTRSDDGDAGSTPSTAARALKDVLDRMPLEERI